MRFFLDNCISPKFGQALEILASPWQTHEIVHLSTKFARNTPDADWITALAKEGEWVIVSGDYRIARSKVEQKAWRESGLTAFFFGDRFSERAFWIQAEEIIRWWPKIVLKAQEAPRGSGFLMPFKAKDFREIYPP